MKSKIHTFVRLNNIISKKLLLLLVIVLTFNFSVAQVEESNATPTPNYRAAAKYSPTNLGKLVHSTSVRPHWLKNGNRFWYQYKTTEGSNYYLVDADNRSKKALFDNEKMAQWLTEITKDPYDAKHLPRFDFKFVKNETAIRFYVTSTEKVEEEKEEQEDDVKEETKETKTDSTETKKKKKVKPKMVNKIYHFEYRLGSNSLTVVDNKKKEKEDWKKWANIAPDSSVVLFSKQYNMYWMDKENFLKAVKNEKDTTIVETQWTTDGEENYGYGGRSWGENNETKIKNEPKSKKGICNEQDWNFSAYESLE